MTQITFPLPQCFRSVTTTGSRSLQRSMPVALALGISASAPFPYTARLRRKEVIAVDLVLAQMIVTGVLLFAFSVEVVVGKLVWE